MAKVILLVCAATPQSPDVYLKKLPRFGKLWGGAWEMGMLGTLKVSTEQPAPRLRKAYPWTIDTVIRFSGNAKPKSDWTALHELAEALLGDVGGALASTTGRPLLTRVPAATREALWRAVEPAIGDAKALTNALEAALKWRDAAIDEDFAPRLSRVLVERGDPGVYEDLARISTQYAAGQWLERGRFVRMLLEAEQAGLPLHGRAREQLDAHHTRSWEDWARRTPPSTVDTHVILREAAAGDRRAQVVLAWWCGHHPDEGAERAALFAAFTRASAERGRWPDALRRPLADSIWKSGAEPAPRGALDPSDAGWVADQLAARAAEQKRYQDSIAGINARNAAMHARMSGR
ncbi:MAG: hypothetical protein QM820_20865 [Minicystis sp.]